MMEPVLPVFWYQGLFLQPHHFQTQERFFQSLLQPFQSLVLPWFWGGVGVRIHESGLMTEAVDVESGQFLFQDGAFVALPDNATLVPRSFKTDWTSWEKPLKVYVGLRKWNISAENVTVTEQPGDVSTVSTRFSCPMEPREVKDLHHGGPPASLRLMKYALKIFWDTEIPSLGDYNLIPIAVLTRDRKEVRLAQHFTHPTPVMGGSDALLRVMKTVREQVSSHCRYLEEYKFASGSNPEEFQTKYAVYLMTLRCLNQNVAWLRQITDQPTTHPWHVYWQLMRLMGDLSTFSNRVNAMGILADGRSIVRDYNHEDPLPCFEDIQTLISELLNDIIVGPERIIDLLRDGDRFSAPAPLELFDQRNVFYLALRTAETAAKVRGAVQGMVKMSSAEIIPTLVTRALSGIPLHEPSSPPPGMPKHANATYYMLDQTSGHWAEIQKSQNFCMYWVGAPGDLKAEIVVLRK